MLKIVAKRYLKPDTIEEYKAVAGELVDYTRREKGCVDYGLYYNAEENLAVMMETWESQEALNDHLRDIIAAGWPARLNAFADPDKKGGAEQYELIY